MLVGKLAEPRAGLETKRNIYSGSSENHQTTQDAQPHIFGGLGSYCSYEPSQPLQELRSWFPQPSEFQRWWGDSCQITHTTLLANFSNLVLSNTPVVAVSVSSGSRVLKSLVLIDFFSPSLMVILEEGLTPGCSSMMSLKTYCELIFIYDVLYYLKPLFLLHTWCPVVPASFIDKTSFSTKLPLYLCQKLVLSIYVGVL